MHGALGSAVVHGRQGACDPSQTAMEPMVVEADANLRVARLIDANLDRAREGLRVIEDWCRFGLDRDDFVVPLKDWRQRLGQRHHDRYRRARSSATDVAAGLGHPAQASRCSAPAIIKANASRVQEALRVLEEFGRNLDPDLASTAAEIRYGLYDLEARILEACGRQRRQERLEAAKLCLITDPDRDNNLERLLHGVESALMAGVNLVQYRRKQGNDQQRLLEAQALKTLCNRFEALFIVNDRIDLALLVDADGVHLGQDDLPLSEARQLLGPERLLGRSTHRLEHLLEAQQAGADYLGVGPVFATKTKRDRSPAGLSWVTEASRHAAVPWFAIGGIDVETIPSVRAAGAQRVAVVSAIMGSNDPEGASRTLLQTLI